MDWSQHGDGEIPGCIERLEIDRAAQLALLEEYRSLDVRTEAALDAIRAGEARCHACIADDDDEIARLRAEIPEPRRG